MSLRLAALLTGPDTYLDHLGVLCYIMNMPLFVTEDKTYEAALTFYPQIQVIKKDLDEIDSLFLAQNFDALFESGKFLALQLGPMIKLLHQKKMRFIYCPHGHSDKGHSAKQHVWQDVSLIYGAHMKELLKNTGASDHIGSILETGNYRLPFYKEHKQFYDNLTTKLIGSKVDPKKKTVLYAPSWQDGENPSSFFQVAGELLQDLHKEFNVILKLHPFLETFHPAETHHIIENYKDLPGIFFLKEFPCIYPLLEICDLYIGDYSSIGYDFLAFDKPLYFLTPKEASNFKIHACGLKIPAANCSSQFIQETLHQNQQEKASIRRSIYEHVFGEDKPFSILKHEILEHLK